MCTHLVFTLSLITALNSFALLHILSGAETVACICTMPFRRLGVHIFAFAYCDTLSLSLYRDVVSEDRGRTAILSSFQSSQTPAHHEWHRLHSPTGGRPHRASRYVLASVYYIIMTSPRFTYRMAVSSLQEAVADYVHGRTETRAWVRKLLYLWQKGPLSFVRLGNEAGRASKGKKRGEGALLLHSYPLDLYAPSIPLQKVGVPILSPLPVW